MLQNVETERLRLRRFLSGDEPDCFAFLSDRETCYLDGGYEPFDTIDEEYDCLMERFRTQNGRFMIVLKAENKVIGTITLRDDPSRVVKTMELGYVISPNYRRRGYMTELLPAVHRQLFSICGVELVRASAIEKNVPSLNLLKKLGYLREGRIRKGFYYPGEGSIDLVSYYLEQAGTQAECAVRVIHDADEKEKIASSILHDLPDWFGMPKYTENYIRESMAMPFWAAFAGADPVGFIALKETSRDTAEVYVMGVLKAHHRTGLGRQLYEVFEAFARNQGYSFVQVKTVRNGCYPEYDRTNRFYLAMGFRELECFPTLWDEWNPCQVYVKSIQQAGNNGG